MLNLSIWTYATCFVGHVRGPLWSTWGAPLGEGKSGAKAGIVNTKVAHRACAEQAKVYEAEGKLIFVGKRVDFGRRTI